MTDRLPDGPDGLRTLARAWLATGRPAMVVEVLAARGSVPREAGTRMLVAAEATAGTIGGGHLEFDAIAEARRALAEGASGRPPRDVALGPSLGQCCGGAVQLGLRRLDAAALADWPDEPPLFHLQLHGAGHVGQALVRLLATLPCRVHWVDDRDSAVEAARAWGPGPLPPHITLQAGDDPLAEVAAAPAGCWFLVMTHSHALDLALVQAVLARGDAGWLGLIGSATKRARFERRLAERGLGDAARVQLVCPVGLPGITGKAPAVVAMAVAAQLLQQAAGVVTQASASRPSAATSSTRTR